ncbi:MAG: hypothetical protein FJ030_12125 [Chloroflexi bacterium]|nr:hypothetical protein [Chloroflexota bacterium]
MDSGMISKIEKAKRYASERDRFRFSQFSVQFHGSNNEHNVNFDHGAWKCDCEYFVVHSWCAHTKALEILLDKMIAEGVPA